MTARDMAIAERTGLRLPDVLRLPADEWMAWSIHLEGDLLGERGTQTLLAKRIAQAASTPENLIDFRDVAPWLEPGHLERRERRRLAALPKALRTQSREAQDEFMRRRGLAP